MICSIVIPLFFLLGNCFHFSGTQYDVLNRKVQKYIRKFECCPDFQDILELVRKCNTKYLDNDIRYSNL